MMRENHEILYCQRDLMIIIMIMANYIFTPSLRTIWIRHKVNFNGSLIGLNSEFSFFKADSYANVEVPSILY